VGACHGEDLGVVLADVVRLGAKASGDDHFAVFQEGLSDGIQAFGFGRVKEPAGVDDHRVGSGVVGRDRVSFGSETGEDPL